MLLLIVTELMVVVYNTFNTIASLDMENETKKSFEITVSSKRGMVEAMYPMENRKSPIIPHNLVLS